MLFPSPSSYRILSTCLPKPLRSHLCLLWSCSLPSGDYNWWQQNSVWRISTQVPLKFSFTLLLSFFLFFFSLHQSRKLCNSRSGNEFCANWKIKQYNKERDFLVLRGMNVIEYLITTMLYFNLRVCFSLYYWILYTIHNQFTYEKIEQTSSSLYLDYIYLD